jgi:MYXO-CTERM domain-containing protein
MIGRLRFTLAAAMVLAPTLASAHIAMDFPVPRTSEQKSRHCGAAVPRGAPNVFLPGATISVQWRETINHLGWYRISFQQNGDVFHLPLGEGGPCGDNSCGCSGAACNFPVTDMTGQTDPLSGSLVIADKIADGTLTFDVTLPNVECDNCTLQLIQLMTNGHGPYDETATAEGNDIYFQCADLVLSSTAPDAAPGGPADADPGNPGGQDAGGNAQTSGGGCSASGESSGASSGILTALALVGLLIRRRRVS